MKFIGPSDALGSLAGLAMALITVPIAFCLARLCLDGLLRMLNRAER